MAWNDRLRFWQPRTDVVEETAVTDYPIETEVVEGYRQNWLMSVALVTAAIAFVVLVAVLANWLYHRSHKPVNTPAVVRPGDTVTVKNPTSSPVKVDNGTGANTNIAVGNNAAGKNGAGKSTAKVQNTPSQLPNNGPGDVVAIFIGATIAGSLIHYSVASRRVSG